MSFWVFVQQHLVAEGLTAWYVGTAIIGNLPDQWQGWYPFIRNVLRTMMNSGPVQKLEQKYNLQPIENHVPEIHNQVK